MRPKTVSAGVSFFNPNTLNTSGDVYLKNTLCCSSSAIVDGIVGNRFDRLSIAQVNFDLIAAFLVHFGKLQIANGIFVPTVQKSVMWQQLEHYVSQSFVHNPSISFKKFTTTTYKSVT